MCCIAHATLLVELAEWVAGDRIELKHAEMIKVDANTSNVELDYTSLGLARNTDIYIVGACNTSK